MKKYFALLCSLTWCMTEWTVARAELVTSAVMTVRFGIEQDWPDSVQLDSRHGDLAAYYCGGAGRLRWDMDAPPATALYDMDEAHAYANSLTRETMSAALLPAYAFIGATNGQTFWNLNQNQMVESGDVETWLIEPADFDGDDDADVIDLSLLVDAVVNGSGE